MPRLEHGAWHETTRISGRSRRRGGGVAARGGRRQCRAHHGGIKRRLAPLAAVGAGDLGKIEIVLDQAQHKVGEMVSGYEILHRRGQKQRLINLPGTE